MRAWAIVLAGCGGSQTVRVVEQMPAGQCPRGNLAPGESCEVGVDDFAAGASVTVPHAHPGALGGRAWFRWTLFDTALDERTMWKGARGYRSLAGAIGMHLRPMLFAPRVARYVDPVVNFGLELGGVYQEKRLQGRGDGYVEAALDLYAPDIGPMKLTCAGVPGLRVGARYTGFVQGWDPQLTFEVGLIWRWGIPIDLYHHWETTRGGD